jgi:hypothetical protein
MALITWKFVDQPIASPTVLLDMNNGTTTRIQGLQMPAPPLRRSVASNAMSDGGIVSSAAYDLRELKFTAFLNGPTLTDKVAQLDALKAQLAKPANLLMFMPPGGSIPVFFQTVRSDDYLPDYAGAARAEWYIQCSILAQPFAIGIRHDITTGAVITNDPASGTNKTFLDITGVRGDSPAPAFVRVALASGTSPTFFWAQRTANNPAALTVFAQAEAGTLGTDTTVQANDVNMSGAGSNFVRTSFSTDAGVVTRLTVTVPTATDASALRGRYRMLAKIRTSASGSNFTMRYVQNPSSTNSTNGPQISFDSSAAITTADLGVVEFPGPGATPTAIGYSGLSAGYATESFAIQIGRNSGSATLDMDFVYLLPADERAAQFRRSNWVAGSYLCIDGPQEMAYGMASGTSPFGGTRTVDNAGSLTSYFGGFPMLVPGVTNRWYALIGAQAASATSTWDVSYWPRWREVATS